MVDRKNIKETDHYMTYDEVMTFLDVSSKTLDELIETNTVYPIMDAVNGKLYFSKWAIKLFRDTITWKEWG